MKRIHGWTTQTGPGALLKRQHRVGRIGRLNDKPTRWCLIALSLALCAAGAIQLSEKRLSVCVALMLISADCAGWGAAFPFFLTFSRWRLSQLINRCQQQHLPRILLKATHTNTHTKTTPSPIFVENLDRSTVVSAIRQVEAGTKEFKYLVNYWDSLSLFLFK